MKRLAALLLVAAMLVATCAASDAKPVLFLQWQKASGGKCADMSKCDMSAKAKCGDCNNCGVSAKEMKKAYSTLKRELATEGVKVKLKKVKANAECAMPSASRVWMSDVPMEVWLGAKTEMAMCGGCKDKPEGGMSHASMVMDGKTYDAVSADLIVQAGHKAADHLLANGKIDPAEFSKPAGCGGCGGKSGCGGKDKKE